MKRICVFCASSSGARPVYKDAARALGSVLVERGLGLVYGGANVGLMGAVADAVLAAGGEARFDGCISKADAEAAARRCGSAGAAAVLAGATKLMRSALELSRCHSSATAAITPRIASESAP